MAKRQEDWSELREESMLTNKATSMRKTYSRVHTTSDYLRKVKLHPSEKSLTLERLSLNVFEWRASSTSMGRAKDGGSEDLPGRPEVVQANKDGSTI